MASPKGGNTASQQNLLHGLTLAAEKQKFAQVQQQMADIQKQFEQLQKQHEGLSKKKELDDEHHKETRKELDKLKSQYDPQHAWEKKVVQKDTMQRARTAKSTTKKGVADKQKEARRGAKTTPTTRAKNTRPRKAS